MLFQPGVPSSASYGGANSTFSSRTTVSTPQGTRVYEQPPVTTSSGGFQGGFPGAEFANASNFGPAPFNGPMSSGPGLNFPPVNGPMNGPMGSAPLNLPGGMNIDRNGIQLPGLSVGPRGIQMQPGFGAPGFSGPAPLAQSFPPTPRPGASMNPSFGAPQGFGPDTFGAPQGYGQGGSIDQGFGAPQSGFGVDPGFGPSQGFGPNGFGQGGPVDPGFGGPQGFGPDLTLPNINLPGLDLKTLSKAGNVTINVYTQGGPVNVGDGRRPGNAGRNNQAPEFGINGQASYPGPSQLGAGQSVPFDPTGFFADPTGQQALGSGVAGGLTTGAPYGADPFGFAGPQPSFAPSTSQAPKNTKKAGTNSELSEIKDLMTTLVMVTLVSTISSSQGGVNPMLSGLLMDMVGQIDPSLAGLVGQGLGGASSDPLGLLGKSGYRTQSAGKMSSSDPLAALFADSKSSSTDPLAALFAGSQSSSTDPLAALLAGSQSSSTDPLAALLAGDQSGLDLSGIDLSSLMSPAGTDDPLGLLGSQTAKTTAKA
jgi:hypothetical protein